ncbi:MAG: hypothetical protein RMJ39_10260 [Deltaproteobacteria bacterium]|nr:hypothetical protein [Deltaproteobacteria bacterium]
MSRKILFSVNTSARVRVEAISLGLEDVERLLSLAMRGRLKDLTNWGNPL